MKKELTEKFSVYEEVLLGQYLKRQEDRGNCVEIVEKYYTTSDTIRRAHRGHYSRVKVLRNGVVRYLWFYQDFGNPGRWVLNSRKKKPIETSFGHGL